MTVEKRSTAKSYPLVSVLSATSKIFGKPVNNRLADLLKKYGFFLFPV